MLLLLSFSIVSLTESFVLKRYIAYIVILLYNCYIAASPKIIIQKNLHSYELDVLTNMIEINIRVLNYFNFYRAEFVKYRILNILLICCF